MGGLVALTLILLWIPQALRQVLLWLYWLQVKEYRLDRFFVLFETRGVVERLDLHFILLKSALLVGALFYREAIFSGEQALLIWAVAVLLLALDGRVFWDLIKHKLRRPQFTLRAKEIFATGILFTLVTATLTFYFDVFRILIAGEVVILASTFLGILWTSPLVWLTKHREVARARQVLSRIKPQVIGITGSYGKTTTKEFLTQLLSQKYSVAKTTGSENTEFGIARKTIKHVVPGIQVFVVEMGAYRRGEIKKLASIASPQMAIVTGIESQHLSLFGSLENIKRAKYELIESLPKNAFAVFNYSNPHCREMAGWARKAGYKVYGYSTLEAGSDADIQGRTVSANIDGVTFELKYNNVLKKFFAPLYGAHFVENLAGAILAARLMRVSWEDISRACRGLSLPKKFMNVIQKKKTMLIDDSWNSTPKGFEAAINYLKLFPDKKIVVTPGIIELGDESARIHKDLGKIMRGMDLVILTNSDFEKPILAGLGHREKVVVADNTEKLKKALARIRGQKAVLLEGRVPESFRKFL